MARRILIVNLHSARNLGDDGIMAGTLAGLARVFPDAQITLAANDPHSWQKYDSLAVMDSLCSWVADTCAGNWRAGLWRMPFYLFLLAVYAGLFRLFHFRPGLRDPWKHNLLQAYYAADLVLSCGGGNFYAHHSPSPGFFWALMALAFPLALGKPVVMLPQSVGPITGRLQRLLARQVFRRVSVIMVREALSAQFLREALGLTNQIYVLPDLAFGLATGKPQTAGERQAAAHKPAIRVGVTVIDRRAQMKVFHNQDAYEQALVDVLEHLQRQYGAELHLFVQCFGPGATQDVRPVAMRLAEKLKEQEVEVVMQDYFMGAAQLQDAYAEMDLVIASRMHAGIFALSRGVPTVMIAYQPKAQGLSLIHI